MLIIWISCEYHVLITFFACKWGVFIICISAARIDEWLRLAYILIKQNESGDVDGQHQTPGGEGYTPRETCRTIDQRKEASGYGEMHRM